jgi:hypothetical protein
VTARAAVRDFLRGGTSMALSISVANVATYGFTVLAARLLGPHEYGAVAALLAAILVVGVLQLGLQATAARRVSADPEHRAEIEHEVIRVGWRAALGLGLVLLALSPLVERLLRLDNLVTAIWLALAAAPLTLMAALGGALPGLPGGRHPAGRSRRRLHRLAARPDSRHGRCRAGRGVPCRGRLVGAAIEREVRARRHPLR